MTEHKLVCPFCHKGEVYVEGSGKVAITVMCPKCTRCFRIRLDTFKAERAMPHKKISRMRGTFTPSERSHLQSHY